MKKIATLLLLLFPTFFSAQISKSAKMGQTTLEELQMKSYDKDPTANAVVLYDQGNLYTYDNKVDEFKTDYYFRIKILKKEGYQNATVKIPYYKKQEIKNIQAITYNLENGAIQKNELTVDKIYSIDLNSNWKQISFTLPNVKVGTVIEYSYAKINPYSLMVDDWYFQSHIPKINSEYHSSIVANYRYNVKLNGYIPLSKNNPSIKKKCVSFSAGSYSNLTGDCVVLSYGIKNVPAFEVEYYLTSRANYISKVSFELESITNWSGKKTEYATSWKSVDRNFRSGWMFGSELRKSTFFKKNLPSELLSVSDPLVKAKKIYYYIQNHFSLNQNNIFSFQKINTKKSFNEKKGSIADINMALYNALKSAGISAKIVMTSTRSNGQPTKLYPILNEFNYLLVHIEIDGKTYFLDATDKQLTFGLVSFTALNGDARVMDFKKGSFWKRVSPSIHSVEKTNLNVSITKEGTVKGLIRTTNTGYYAYSLRNKLNKTNEEAYKEDYEDENELLINSYKVIGEDNKSERIVQRFNFTLEDKKDQNLQNIYFNPFFHKALTTNPFKLESRLYPVNFGFKLSSDFKANIAIPDNYTVAKLPESKAFSLPNNGGSFIFNIKQIGGKIAILFKFKLNKVEYTSEEYFALKEFFNQIVKAHTSIIRLEKINQ